MQAALGGIYALSASSTGKAQVKDWANTPGFLPRTGGDETRWVVPERFSDTLGHRHDEKTALRAKRLSRSRTSSALDRGRRATRSREGRAGEGSCRRSRPADRRAAVRVSQLRPSVGPRAGVHVNNGARVRQRLFHAHGGREVEHLHQQGRTRPSTSTRTWTPTARA